MALIALLVPLSRILFAYATSVWVCYLAAAVMGIAYALGAMIPCAILKKIGSRIIREPQSDLLHAVQVSLQ